MRRCGSPFNISGTFRPCVRRILRLRPCPFSTATADVRLGASPEVGLCWTCPCPSSQRNLLWKGVLDAKLRHRSSFRCSFCCRTFPGMLTCLPALFSMRLQSNGQQMGCGGRFLIHFLQLACASVVPFPTGEDRGRCCIHVQPILRAKGTLKCAADPSAAELIAATVVYRQEFVPVEEEPPSVVLIIGGVRAMRLVSCPSLHRDIPASCHHRVLAVYGRAGLCKYEEVRGEDGQGLSERSFAFALGWPSRAQMHRQHQTWRLRCHPEWHRLQKVMSTGLKSTVHSAGWGF